MQTAYLQLTFPSGFHPSVAFLAQRGTGSQQYTLCAEPWKIWRHMESKSAPHSLNIKAVGRFMSLLGFSPSLICL